MGIGPVLRGFRCSVQTLVYLYAIHLNVSILCTYGVSDFTEDASRKVYISRKNGHEALRSVATIKIHLANPDG